LTVAQYLSKLSGKTVLSTFEIKPVPSLFKSKLNSLSGQNRMTRSVTGLATNVVEELEDKFVSGTNITKKAIKLLKKKFDEFDALIKEADQNIHVVQQDIASLTTQNLKFTKDFLTDYHTAKEEVRIIRQDLRKLARKTVSACNKMKKLIENWDEKENAFIKEQFKFMRLLLEESLETLENAKIRYNKAITSINKATEQLRLFSEKVYNMTDVNSQEYQQWTSDARAAAYTTAAGVSIGLLVADIFGCLGNQFTLIKIPIFSNYSISL
jgi:prefoldin subunit 5